MEREPKRYTGTDYVTAGVIGFVVTLYLLTRWSGAPPAARVSPAAIPAASSSMVTASQITGDVVLSPGQHRATPLPYKQQTGFADPSLALPSKPVNNVARNLYVMDLFEAINVAGVQWDRVRIAVGHVELGGAKKQEVLERLEEAIPALAAADKLHKSLTPTPDLLTVHDLAGKYIGLTQRTLEFIRHHYTGSAAGEALAVSNAQQMNATYQRLVSAMQAWRVEHPEQKNSLTDTIFANLGQK